MRKRSLILIGSLGVLLLLLWFYFPVFSRYRELKAEQEEMARKIQELDQKIAVLLEEKRLLEEDREYLEKMARSELGLVKPGEEVYKFVEEEPAAGQEVSG